jgi:localization factor PodJL
MKLGVPWGLKGIKPEARDAAKEAARRAGMSLDEWLNSAIAHSAAQMGVQQHGQQLAHYPAVAGGRYDPHAPLPPGQRPGQPQRGPEAYAPPHLRAAQRMAMATLPHLPKAPALQPAMQPQRPPVRWAQDIDHAVAEISARQQALGAPVRPAARQAPQQAPQHAPQQAPQQAPMQRRAPARPHGFAPPPAPAAPQPAARPPVPAQDLSGLEDQLKHITAQIETLRKPGVEEAINALRGELADISRAMTEAMPRQAIEAIEAQVHELGSRIAEGRQNGGNQQALAGLEHGLMEVREALHTLTPAESLVGFNEAIHNLAHKIDYIVAQKDPAMLQQLEGAIVTLRDISDHIASNEMVGRLASDVEALSEKIERIANAAGAGDALANLEHRIAALSDALAARNEAGDHVPPRLEALVESLTDKIERIQHSRSDDVVVSHLEDRIVKLVERLDASDSRLSHLEAIERGLADLLVYIEDLRNQKTGAAPAALPEVHALKDDMARTKVSLDAVHGTLGHVVDRLAAIEQNFRRAPPAPAAPAQQQPPQPQVALNQIRFDEDEPLELPVSKIAVRAVPADAPPAPKAAAAMPQPAPPQIHAQVAAPPQAPVPAPQAQVPAAPKPRPPMQGKRKPINPDLPPDEPLEPGTRMPASPAERIAASEADLGDAKPEEAKPAGGKSFFLAAARRAAKAALRDKTPRLAKVAAGVKASRPIKTREAEDFASEDMPSLRPSLFQRVKKLLVAASVIAIVIGLIQIAANYYNLGRPGVVPKEPSANTVRPLSDNEAGRKLAAAPDRLPGALPGSLPDMNRYGIVRNPAATPSVPGVPTTALSSATELNGRLLSPRADDVTGSIKKTEGAGAANHSGNADKLPAAIGGQKLRDAAAAGNPAAAYEVGVRYLEGRGVTADAGEGMRWLERAAAKGLAPAQFRLASMLEKGHGVKKDVARARKLYAAAAEQGNGKAMHNLAVLYAEGINGRPDYTAASEWFKKAAERGVSDSQYNLAVLYARGLGVEKNFSESYKWFALAAAQGDKEAANKRDDVAGQLDARALAKVQKTVKAWTPQRQPDAAINVPAPPEGWDEAAPHTAPVKQAAKTSASFQVGKR